MATEKLEKTEWRVFFDRLSKALAGRRVEIEVGSLRLGSQIEAQWLPLMGITYDAKRDLLDIALEGIAHSVRQPQAIFVDRDGVQVNSLEVVGGADERAIVKLREPLLLAAPTRPAGPAL